MKKFLSLVTVLFISGFAYAVPPQSDENMPQRAQHQHQQKIKHDFDKILKEANITDEQKNKMEQFMQSDIAKKKELRKQIKEKMKNIDEELLKEDYDINVINGLSSEIQQLNSEISKINVNSKLQIRNILTYEQFKQLEQHRQKMQGKIKSGNKEN